MSSRYLPSGFSSIRLYVLGKMSSKEFQDGRHLGYWNEINWAFLNLHVVPISPISFQLNPTLPWVRCRLKNFKIAAIFDIETKQIEQFWISMSPRYLPSSISSIRLCFRMMSLKEFQDGRHLGYRNEKNSIILNFHIAPIPPIKLQLNLTFHSRDVVKRISRWPPSWISKRNEFRNSESPCRPDISHQVVAQSDFPFGWRCRFKNFKIAAIFDIGTQRF